MKTNELHTIELLDVKIDSFTIESLHAIINNVIKTAEKAIVANVNVHAMNISVEQPWFRQFLNDSEYVFCDGHGVMLGARLVGEKLPEKITYAQWFPLFCDFCEQNGFSLYLLGGETGIAEKAAEKLQKRCPMLKVVGCHDGFFDKNTSAPENQAIIDEINICKPNVLLTSFGMPVQERWLSENWSKIDANIALTGGAALDYMAGKSKRPPKWMTETGFEWLGRMVYEPKRLWRRYVIGNPLFFARLLVWSFKRRFNQHGK